MDAIIAFMRDGNVPEVRQWIMAKETDLDIGDDHRFTLLHWAAREGKLEIVNMLLYQGARINVTNYGLDTPFHLAAAHGHADVLKLLLDNWPHSVDLPNEYGNTPLHYACFWSHVKIIQMLLDRGACPLYKNDCHLTPMNLAPANIHTLLDVRRNNLLPSEPLPSVERDNVLKEILSKDPTLIRGEDVDWEPRNINTFDAVFQEICYKYYHGKFQNNAILVKIVETPDLKERQKRDIREELLQLRIFNHPNIMPVLGHMAGAKLCLFTEDVTYGTLFEMLHSEISGNISVLQTYRFALDIAKAMVFLHTPELKVNNFRLNSKHVMVTADLSRIHLNYPIEYYENPQGRFLIDPEHYMARLNLADTSLTSLFKAREYNPAWMSPEALKNKPNSINAQASDVWSFGVILWELIRRDPPFHDLAPMVAGMQIATEDMTLPLITNNERINRLVKLCTNKEPKNRPRFDLLVPILMKMCQREQLNYS